MSNQKVKELRFGPPLSWKTGAVGTTYPTPLLLFNFQANGWVSIRRPTTVLNSATFRNAMKGKAPFADVTVVDYAAAKNKLTASVLMPTGSERYSEFVGDFNHLYEYNPFATVVIDPYTLLDVEILNFVVKLDPDIKYPGRAMIAHYGYLQSKKRELIGALLGLDCHCVMIGHEESQKDEVTGEINTVTAGTGKFQETMGMHFAQVLYARIEADEKGNARPIVHTKPFGRIKSLGMRWPDGKPAICGATFHDLYE